MPVMLAVMEIPGCLVALYLVARLRHKGMDALGNMPDEPGYDPSARPLDGVPDIQQDLEVQLLAPVREIECRHLRLIIRCFRALERFGVHLIEIGQNTITRPGHTQRLEGSKGQAGRIGRRLLRGSRRGDQQPLGCLSQEQARTDRISHDEL